MLGEEKTLSAEVTVCGASSLLLQVTVPPTGTVSSAGAKLKFAISTCGPLAVPGTAMGRAGGVVARAAGGTGVDGGAGAAEVVEQAAIAKVARSIPPARARRHPGVRSVELCWAVMSSFSSVGPVRAELVFRGARGALPSSTSSPPTAIRMGFQRGTNHGFAAPAAAPALARGPGDY